MLQFKIVVCARIQDRLCLL